MGPAKPIFMKKKSRFSLFRTLVTALCIVFAIGIIYVVVMAKIDSRPLDIAGVLKEGTRRLVNIKKPGEYVFKHRDSITILCIGLDESRDHRGIAHHKGSRTDTLFLLHLQKNGNRLGVLSIPRDTLVYLSDGYGRGKINSAYPLAFLDEYEDSDNNYEQAKATGVKQVRETAEEFMGVPVDYYVLIKITGAREFADAIGGLTMDVEKDMDYDDNWGNLHIHLKKGRQKLSGQQVVGYARFRHDEEGDWGRIRRQQQVLKALVKKLKEPSNVMRINKIAKVIETNIETDIPFKELVDLALVYKNFNKENMVRGVITGTDDMWGGAAVIIPTESEKERLIARILRDPEHLKPEDMRIRVHNGCGIDGLAHNIADKLREKGYDVVDVGNAEKEDVEKTEIVDHYRNNAGAKEIEKLIGKSVKIVKKSCDNKELNPDFTIILGKDLEDEKKAEGVEDTTVLPQLEPGGPGGEPTNEDEGP